MSTKLKEAYILKEKAELFLSNLEKLKTDGAIAEAQYGVLKAEYTKMRDDAISEVNSIKAYIKRELDDKVTELGIFKLELANLEARFKVGQIPAEAYLRRQKGPKRRADELERRASELQALVDSNRSADIIVPQQGMKVFGFNLWFQGKKQLPAQEMPVMPIVTNVPEVTELVIPPGVYITNMQIMPDRVLPGSTVGIIIVITNSRQDIFSQKIELKINGTVKDAREVTLAPGTSQEITFTALENEPGEYQVAIGSLTGKFSVIPR